MNKKFNKPININGFNIDQIISFRQDDGRHEVFFFDNSCKNLEDKIKFSKFMTDKEIKKFNLI